MLARLQARTTLKRLTRDVSTCGLAFEYIIELLQRRGISKGRESFGDSDIRLPAFGSDDRRQKLQFKLCRETKAVGVLQTCHYQRYKTARDGNKKLPDCMSVRSK
jgi:hypothetical protein